MKKFALLYIPVALVILLVVIWVGLVLTHSDKEKVFASQIAQVEFGNEVASSWIKTALDHVQGMLREPDMLTSTQRPPSEAQSWMESHLMTLLYRNPLYDRARWVSKSGQELVRIQQTEDKPASIPQDKLSNVSERSWFKEILSQPPDKIYLSPLNLSMEENSHGTPLKPVIRFGVRLPLEGEADDGILAVNLRVDALLERLRGIKGPEGLGSIMLLNSQGDWLISPDRQDAFAFARGAKENSFAKRYPTAWAHMVNTSNGQIITADGLWTWATIDPLSIVGSEIVTKESWKLVTYIPAQVMTAMAWNRWWPLLTIAAVALGILAVGGWQYRQLWEQRDAGKFELALAAEKQAAERKLRMATEGADVGVWSWDFATNTLIWSEICKQHLALPAGEKESFEHFYRTVHPEDLDRIKHLIEESVKQQQSYATECRIVHADGTIRWVAAQGRTFFNADGSIESMGGATLDVTRRKEAEQKLQELNFALEHRIEERTASLSAARERLSKTIESAPSGVGLISPEGRLLEANPAFCAFFGRDIGTIKSMTWQELTHPDDLQADLDFVEQMKANKIQNYQIQKRYLRPDGSVVWGLLSVACLRHADATIQYFISQIADINDEVKARLNLTESQNHFRLLAENASDVVVQTDNEGVIQWTSPSTLTTLGLAPEQLHGMGLCSLIHPEEWDALEALLGQLRRGTLGNIEARIRIGESGYRWFSISMRPLLDASGRGVGCVGGFRDIHQQMQDREAIQAERRHLKTTLDSMLDPHVLVQPLQSADGRVEDFLFATVNPAACAWMGIHRDRLLGRRITELLPALETTGLMEFLRKTAEIGSETILDNFEFPLGNANTRLDIRAVYVDGRVSIFWRDVTERHLAVEQIAASEERYRLLAQNSSDVVVRIDKVDKILWISPSITPTLGWKPEECEGKNVPEFLADDVSKVRFKVGKNRLTEGQVVVNRFKMRAKSGSTHWIEFHAGPDRDKDGQIVGVIASFRIVDREVVAERQLEKLAKSDALTGLNNRRSFEVFGRREVSRACRHGEPLAVLMMDIDHFKEINDTYGHDAGDEVLKLLAQICVSQLRDIDLIARLGGEEFALLLSNTDLKNAQIVAERIRTTLAQTAVTTSDGTIISFTVSIGLVPLSDTLRDLKALLKKADDALYFAKKTGRNRVCTTLEEDSFETVIAEHI